MFLFYVHCPTQHSFRKGPVCSGRNVEVSAICISTTVSQRKTRPDTIAQSKNQCTNSIAIKIWSNLLEFIDRQHHTGCNTVNSYGLPHGQASLSFRVHSLSACNLKTICMYGICSRHIVQKINCTLRCYHMCARYARCSSTSIRNVRMK